MTNTHRARNQALLRFIALPWVLLTVVLLGGLRISMDNHAFIFLPPSLITLVLALLILALAVRSGLINLSAWLSMDQPTLALVSNALVLVILFFAAAQALNSVLPEQGLLHWLFSFFFLWTLWNNQFSGLDARRAIRSLAVLFVTAFLLKSVIFAGINAPDGSWLRRLAAGVIESFAISNAGATSYASATGYISFFTILLFVAGLALLSPEQPITESHHEQPLLAGPASSIMSLQNSPVEVIQGEAISEEEIRR
jgi:hypothetical protein